MSPRGKYLTPNETQSLQHDLRQMLGQCDAMFAGIAQHERAKIDRLRSAFLMMHDMGYTADEAKAEFTRFQAEFNADRDHDQTKRSFRQRVNGSCSRAKSKHRMSGVKQYRRTFTLCLVVIPILFLVGIVTELWFHYNPWGRAYFNIRYVKAVLYIGIWYSLMKALLPWILARALTTFLMFAGIGLAVSHENVVRAWGANMYGATLWSSFWLDVQWCYWGLLALTYLCAWWRLAHGPRYWILKHGVSWKVA